MNRLDKLNLLKEKDKFPLEEWDERGLIPSPQSVRTQMNKSVNNLIDHVITLGDNPSKQELTIGIQSYIDGWERSKFDTEEMEYIFDVMAEIIQSLGIELDQLQI